MKKSVLSLFILLTFVGLILIYSGVVLADDDEDNGNSGSSSGGNSGGSSESDGSGSDDGDNGESSSGSGSGDDNDDEEDEETRTIINENGTEVEIRIKTEIKDGEIEIEERRTFIDENGNKVVIKTKTEIKDGENETEIKRKITTPDGVEITFKTKTEIEDGKTEIKNSIEVEGAEVTTKLSVKEETRGNQTRLKATLSTGAEQEIIVMPDEALQIAFEELRATSNFTFELSEVIDGDTRKAVFSARATKPGKLLGIFNTQVDLETLIDTQTGQVIKTNRPWWAFLIAGANDAAICHVPAEDLNKRRTLNVTITAVRGHLGHGDSVGECAAVCGDGIIVEGVEVCEEENKQVCTTVGGYSGNETCNATCSGFNTCVTTEACGDGIVNGPEQCDDSNVISGDGCDNSCQIEVTPTPSNTTNTTDSTV